MTNDKWKTENRRPQRVIKQPRLRYVITCAYLSIKIITLTFTLLKTSMQPSLGPQEENHARKQNQHLRHDATRRRTIAGLFDGPRREAAHGGKTSGTRRRRHRSRLPHCFRR